MDNLVVVNEAVNNDKQYIIFRLDKAFFGLDIECINTIIMMPKITKIPMAPYYFAGMINLRDRIIPVISLRKRMGFGEDEITKDSRIIVLNLEDDKLMGIIVDDVKEVTTISDTEIQPSSTAIRTEESFVRSIGKKNNELISIFEVESLIA